MRRNAIHLSRLFSRHFSYNPWINHDIETNPLPLGQHRIPGFLNRNDRRSRVAKTEVETIRPYSESHKVRQRNCWSCQQLLDTSATTGTKESFFCSNCGSLQEVDTNYVRRKCFRLRCPFDFKNETFSEFFFVIWNRCTVPSRSERTD